MKLPKGFRYSSVYAGIRKVEKDDLALIVSDQPASAAAVFTTNQVKAAPVDVAQQNLKQARGRVRAILVNAGNANCATRTGHRVATETVNAVAKALGTEPAHVLPASTGVIGVELDATLILNAIPRLVEGLNANRFDDAARAILTTDTCSKTAFASVGRASIAGMTKGSGMIQPRMATTLGFVMTDAEIPRPMLSRALKQAIAESYNRISVDGDTSTNDMVAILANGSSGVQPDEQKFQRALTGVLRSLAQQIARDGEGAPTSAAAETIARAIANSPLVKTAIAGSDPNWGRILSAAGNAGVAFDPRDVDVEFQGVRVCRGGLAAEFSEDALKKKLDERECKIKFSMRRSQGKASADFWTCDFTEEYIRINASYRT
jgi:glutamate N-acetyltransferase/amino-acid N-acetyltransferase